LGTLKYKYKLYNIANKVILAQLFLETITRFSKLENLKAGPISQKA